MSQIETFIFFDIETTGLPWQERNQTKIIEFSFVAVLREDLEVSEAGSKPPVCKLTFVLNPQRRIHPDVTKMTGLSNKQLRQAPLFKDKIKTITSFLQDLPKPVCLVAHNGNVFDYKILLAELNDAFASLPDDLLCVDSLVGFRKLLKGTNINYHTILVAKESKSLPSLTDEDLLTDDEDEWPDFDISQKEWEEIDEMCASFSDISTDDISETEQKEKIKRNKSKAKESRSRAIKNVFQKKNVNGNKDCFTLSALYRRLLNKEEPNAHRAEVDCMMLIQCVLALKNDFLPWADGACKLLTQIKPIRMESKKKKHMTKIL